MKKVVRNVLLGIVALVGTKLFVALTLSDTKAMSDTERLEGVAAIANKSYPKMSSNGVRIDKVTNENGALVFNKTLTENTVDDFDQRTLEGNRSAVAAEFCNSGSRSLLDEGITLGTRYHDKNGRMVIEYKITRADCQ